MRRLSVALLVLTLSPAIAHAAGFTFCAVPTLPACVDNPETYRKPDTTSACEAETERTANATAAYRACLYHQLEVVIGTTNSMLGKFRCGKKGGKNCR